MRETFLAHGKLERDGSFRSWRNGNLRVTVEPTESGYRLRLRTFKGSTQGALLGSFAAFATALAFLVVPTLTNKLDWAKITILILTTLTGLGNFGFTAFRPPRWANERARQMEAISAKAIELSGAHLETEPIASDPSSLLDLDSPVDSAEDKDGSEQARPTPRIRF